MERCCSNQDNTGAVKQTVKECYVEKATEDTPCCTPPETLEALEKPRQGAKLHNIGDIRELRSAFNRAKGHPRLVLLFSPTCCVCVNGASWVQKEILAKHPDSPLKVYAIWLPMIPDDARSRWQPGLLTDSRVTHFWDENCVVGRFFAKHSDPPSRCEVQWDALFVYGPEASWDKSPAPLRSFGRPVKPAGRKLQAALVPLLKVERDDSPSPCE